MRSTMNQKDFLIIVLAKVGFEASTFRGGQWQKIKKEIVRLNFLPYSKHTMHEK